MAYARFLLSFTLLAASIQAGPLDERQLTTSSAAAVTTGPLIETTIDGKVTTIPVSLPTGTSASTTTGNSPSKTSNSAATNTVSEGAPGVPDDTALSCRNDKNQPICLPHANQQLFAGNIYWIQWSSTAFSANTSIIVGLQYENNASQAAWTSNPLMTQRGFIDVKIEESWLEGYDARNVSLVWNAYSSVAGKLDVAFQVEIAKKPVEHFPAPAKSKVPDKQSLLIALPVTLGVLFLVLFGLYFGMRSHRHIGLKSVMGRGRRGYGTGKSRRERLGIKKGAIRLEDREVFSDTEIYRDDDDIVPAPLAPQITKLTDKSDSVAPERANERVAAAPPQLKSFPAPPQASGHNFYSSTTVPKVAPKEPTHNRDLSLGSLLTDDDSNSFRREVLNQQKEKQ